MTIRSAVAGGRARVGLVGARGHVGAELVPLLAKDPHVTLCAAVSRQRAGERLAGTDVAFEALSPSEAAARGLDAWILALPNGEAAAWVRALDEARGSDGRSPIVVDLSADHRFDAAWRYGLPELHRASLAGARRIAAPGCYATGMQVALASIRPLLDGPAHVFGVSGHSGAGTTPSPRNDPDALRDNLMPYSLVGHVHEREASHHLGHPVRFTPHVAPFFRGIALTIHVDLGERCDAARLLAVARARFAGEPLVRVTEAAPLVRDAMGTDHVTVGGFTVDETGRRAVLCATLDNLRKGAATQAVQALHLALGVPELAGIVA